LTAGRAPQAAVLTLLPTHFFFIFLYYTDVGSLTLVLAAYLARRSRDDPGRCRTRLHRPVARTRRCQHVACVAGTRGDEQTRGRLIPIG
jgi:hypothetical protein